MSTRQEFTTLDVLRLEVETDPTGLVNLVQNPNGELGGWGWITPVANSVLKGISGPSLEYTSPGSVASYFYTEPMAIAATQYAAAMWNIVSLNGYYRVKFEWLDSSKVLLSSSTQTGYLNATGVVNYGPYQAPASTAYVRLRFDHYSTNTGTAPTAGQKITFNQVTVAKATTSAALGTTRTNLVPNPSFETNTTGWFVESGSGAALARSTAQASTGSACLRYYSTVASSFPEVQTPTGTAGIPVVGGAHYTAQCKIRAATTTRTIQIRLIWWDASGVQIGTGTWGTGTETNSSWTQISVTTTAPTNAAYASLWIGLFGTAIGTGEDHYIDAVLLEKASTVSTYFDGSTAAGGGWTYAWTGTANNSTSSATSSNLSYIEPVPYLNVLGPTHEIGITRGSLGPGILTATILDATLDPSQDDLIRPGRQCRVLLHDPVTGLYEPLFTGKIGNANVTYDLRDPSVKRARIELNAIDNIAQVANVARNEGVATIAALPYVLEGAGVPWNVNGSGNQVASATVVALNPNASALDQVAITRDTVRGYAWVDRRNIVKAYDAAQMPSAVAATLDETAYTDLDVSFNTGDCINEVNIKWLRYNATTGETEEIPYGPYRDQSSIDTWGPHAAEFTICGAAESATDIAAYASAVLAANATPVVRINTVQVPIATDAHLSTRALLDLYDLAQVANADAGINESSRVATVEHSITPDVWTLRLGFADPGSVAAPQSTPSPTPGNLGGVVGSGAAAVPVGGLAMFAATSPPVGWLICDGASKAVTDYPALFAVIGYTYGGSGANFNLPNLVNRFPIGGTPVGAVGGSSTITSANLPAHAHTIAHTHTTPVDWTATTTATGSNTRVTNVGNLTGAGGTSSGNATTSAASTGNSGNGPGTGAAYWPPYLKVGFIIKF